MFRVTGWSIESAAKALSDLAPAHIVIALQLPGRGEGGETIGVLVVKVSFLRS